MSEQLPKNLSLEALALSPAEQRAFPRWYTDLLLRKRADSVAIGDVMSFVDNFGLSPSDKSAITGVFGERLVTVDPPQFYVFLRLTGHVLQGKRIHRELAFVAAPVPRPRPILASKARAKPQQPQDMDSFMSLMTGGGGIKKKKRVTFDSRPPQVAEAAHRSMSELLRQHQMHNQLPTISPAPPPPPPPQPSEPDPDPEPEVELPINNQFAKLNIESVLHNGTSSVPAPPAPRKQSQAGDSFIQQLTQNAGPGGRLQPQHSGHQQPLQMQYSGLQPQGTGLQQQGTGLQQQGTGLQQQGTGLQQQGTGLQQQGTGLQQQGTGLQQQGTGLQQQGTGLQQGSGLQQQGTGLQQQGTGFQQQGTGFQGGFRPPPMQSQANIYQPGGIQPQGTGMQPQGTGLQPQGTGMFTGLQQPTSQFQRMRSQSVGQFSSQLQGMQTSGQFQGLQPQGSGQFQGLQPQGSGQFQPLQPQGSGQFMPQTTLSPNITGQLQSHPNLQHPSLTGGPYVSGQMNGHMGGMQSNLQYHPYQQQFPQAKLPTQSTGSLPLNMQQRQGPPPPPPSRLAPPSFQSFADGLSPQGTGISPSNTGMAAQQSGMSQSSQVPPVPNIPQQFVGNLPQQSQFHITPPPQYVRQNQNQTYNMQALRDQMPNW